LPKEKTLGSPFPKVVAINAAKTSVGTSFKKTKFEDQVRKNIEAEIKANISLKVMVETLS
jgi:hypothetical protein